MSFWVGLGDAGDHLEQTGTECWCQRHTPAVSDAWLELYPAPKVETDVAVRSGDVITATVVRLGQSHFRLTLANATTGRRFSIVKVVRGVGDTHGAIVAEESSFSDTDLAGFAPVHFTACALKGRPMDGYRLTSFAITTDDGVAETTTSEVGGDGASFTVTRR